jgi:hypothetical protein
MMNDMLKQEQQGHGAQRNSDPPDCIADQVSAGIGTCDWDLSGKS